MFRANKKRKYKNWETYNGKENRLLFQVPQVLFKSIITSGMLQTEEFSSLLSNIELDFTKTLLSLTTPTKTKVQS